MKNKSKKFDEMQISQMNEQSYLILKFLSPFVVSFVYLTLTVISGINILFLPITAVFIGITFSVYLVRRIEITKFMIFISMTWLIIFGMFGLISSSLLGKGFTYILNHLTPSNSLLTAANIIVFSCIPITVVSLFVTLKVLENFGYELAITKVRHSFSASLFRILKTVISLVTLISIFIAMIQIGFSQIDLLTYYPDVFAIRWQLFVLIPNLLVMLYLIGQSLSFTLFKYINFRRLLIHLIILQILVGVTLIGIVAYFSRNYGITLPEAVTDMYIPVWSIYLVSFLTITVGLTVRVYIERRRGNTLIDFESRRKVLSNWLKETFNQQ